MIMSTNYSLLVNTTDSFEDCWVPFFTLFKKFWPDYNGKIYLNTETKIFTFPGLNIVSVQNNIKTPNKRITWSECLIRALNSIDSEIILYMQEDYFLKDSVKNNLVEKYVLLMHENSNIHCIHLTDQGSPAERTSYFEGLWHIPKNHQDRISCQAALWRKDVLLQYLRVFETAWNFEWWGSKRAAILKHNFYVVDKNWVKLNQFEIIPYIFTGVIGGRWYKEILPVFEKNNIIIDYSERGFFETKNKTMIGRLRAKMKRFPVEIESSIDLFRLRLQTIMK
jgi:hypothetical protein